jgi:hypothetical protein
MLLLVMCLLLHLEFSLDLERGGFFFHILRWIGGAGVIKMTIWWTWHFFA